VPKYSWEAPYLVLTLYRNPESVARSLDKQILNQLTEEEQKGWMGLSSWTQTSQKQYALLMGVTARTAQRHLTHFVELGLLLRVGRGRATRYLMPISRH
jgi:Fic family protein